MALKFSKMSARRIDLARNLEAGFTNYQEALAGGYVDFATPLLEEGETAPDVSFHVELMKRGVARGRRRLQNFDGGVVEQTHEDEKVRDELEGRHDAVDGKMRLARHLCRGLYGQKGVDRVGLKEEPPRASAQLYEQGLVVKASLENPDLGLEPLIEIKTGEGVATLSEQLAAQLEPELSELGELVTDRHEENRKAADLRSRRRSVLQEFDRDVRAIVRTAQGLDIYLVHLNFALIDDAERRKRFQTIPTTLQLSKEDVDALVNVAPELLRAEPEFQTLLDDLGAEFPSSDSQ